MSAATTPVLQSQPLGPLWPTMDPFLFCAHHDDAYPPSDGRLGVQAVGLEGRQMGSDWLWRTGVVAAVIVAPVRLRPQEKRGRCILGQMRSPRRF